MDQQYLWFEKHAPKRISELTYNETATRIMESLSKTEDFPHLIFYGKEGAGKKTRIYAFLEEIYGSGVRKVVSESKSMKVNNQQIDYIITSSNFHIELTPTDLDRKDRILIQSVIKETASSLQLDQKSQKKFKVIVLLDVDNLTKDAQAALRRTMEIYAKNCRIIMSCSSLNKIIDPIRSRSICLRVGAPDENEIVRVLKDIAQKEGINENYDLEKIAKNANGNLRRAINIFQLSCINKSKDIYVPEYESKIQQLCMTIKNKRSVDGISECRKLIHSLIVSCIPANRILYNLMNCFIADKSISEKQKSEIINLTAQVDYRGINGDKIVIHLEYYCCQTMQILNNNI